VEDRSSLNFENGLSLDEYTVDAQFLDGFRCPSGVNNGRIHKYTRFDDVTKFGITP